MQTSSSLIDKTPRNWGTQFNDFKSSFKWMGLGVAIFGVAYLGKRIYNAMRKGSSQDAEGLNTSRESVME